MTSAAEPFPDDRSAETGVGAAESRLRAAGVEPSAWSNGPGVRYEVHEHATTKLLICAEGSITFLIGPEATRLELSAGHGLVLRARTPHAAIVGANGCTCLEGHRPG